MQHVTHIRSDEARRVHAALVDALGSETNPAQWMTFMRTVREQLPAVLSRGRPTKAAIERSPIGALGFNTWREMCEAPVEQRGLGLPWSTWRQWSRAWSVVQQHPRLENAPLTAAEVNRLHSEAKAADEPMPDDMAAVEAFQERQTERKKAAREETQTALKQRVEALEADLAASREEAARTNGAVAELREMLDSAQSALAEAEQERRQALLDLRSLQRTYEETVNSMRQSHEYANRLLKHNQEIQQALDEYRNRGFWQRLQDVFSPR